MSLINDNIFAMDAIRIILACIKNADLDFNLINNGDRIAIGASGGKDSMALLYALNLYRTYSKIEFDIIPITIDLGFDGFDSAPIKEYCSSLGLDLKIADGTTVYQILKIQKDKQNLNKLPCSICSRMKKAIINKEAHKYKCNKVTFAHHKTDAIETLFLNEIYGGRIATFSPKMFLTNEKITFIRPLIYADESDIKKLVREKNIPIFPSYCPNDGKTKRTDIKNILLELNKNYPESKNNFLTMLNNREKEDLFHMHRENKIDGTDLYYKEVFDIPSFIKEQKYIKATANINAKSHHIHLFYKGKFVGAMLLYNKDRQFFVPKIYVESNDYFKPFLIDIYKKIYAKVNPIEFFVKHNSLKTQLIDMKFEKTENGYYKSSLNPVKLDLFSKF